MALSRRGFLGTLLAGTAGLLLPKDALWLPPAEPIIAPALAPSAIIGLRRMTTEVARLLALQVKGYSFCSDEGHKIGQVGLADGALVCLTDQFSVDLSDPPNELDAGGLSSERWIQPIANAFASRLQAKPVWAFGTLDIPSMAGDGYVVMGEGVSVRGLRFYDVYDQMHRIRFDIITGA